MNDLVEGLKAGHARAFEQLVRGYGDRIFRFVKRIVGERAAEDVAQEVMIRVFRSIGRYRPTGRFESWLFTLANNLAIDQVRKRRPEASLSELGGDVSADQFASGSPEPSRRLEEGERREAILVAVEELSVEQKQVFLLREEGGLTFTEIAKALGCPINTALGRMHYAMDHLRRSLKAHGLR